LSAFIFATELFDFVKGNLAILKILAATLAGLGAGFATSHSSLFVKRKGK